MACLLVEELEAQERTKAKRKRKKANPSTPQHKCWGLVLDPSSGREGAAEWVNLFKTIILLLKKNQQGQYGCWD